jgi:hypothetical protein
MSTKGPCPSIERYPFLVTLPIPVKDSASQGELNGNIVKDLDEVSLEESVT